jgi:hypothetical protein
MKYLVQIDIIFVAPVNCISHLHRICRNFLLIVYSRPHVSLKKIPSACLFHMTPRLEDPRGTSEFTEKHGEAAGSRGKDFASANLFCPSQNDQ